jgi:hypothetical protein
MGFGLVTRFIDNFFTRLVTKLHCYTHTSVLSVTASNRRCLVTDPTDGDSSSFVLTSLLSGEYPATELLSTANPQLITELSHSPANHFSSLHSTEPHSAGLGSWLYSIEADPTENIRFHCNFVVYVSFPQELVYRVVTNKRLFLLAIVA